MPKLDGKVSLVTGGTSGIGLAAANALAKEGAHVYITGRREPELRTSAQRIGRNATGVRGDVSKAHDLDRLFAQIKDEKGKLDILFANAGIARYATLGNITEELFDSIFNVNVKGVLFTVQKALPLMPDGASVILNASVVGGKGLSSTTRAQHCCLSTTLFHSQDGGGCRLPFETKPTKIAGPVSFCSAEMDHSG